jgi:hypothetical protein
MFTKQDVHKTRCLQNKMFTKQDVYKTRWHIQIYIYLIPQRKNVTVGVVSSPLHVSNGPSNDYICFCVFHSLHWPQPSCISEHRSSGIRQMSNPQLHCHKNLRTNNGLSLFSLPPMDLSGLATWSHSNAQSYSVNTAMLSPTQSTQ